MPDAMQHNPFPSSSSQPPQSTQPHPPKEQNNRRKKPNPNLPPDARLLRHPQHAIHSALNFMSRILKLVVHLLSKGSGVADFVADEVCQLNSDVSTILTVSLTEREEKRGSRKG
jgi:hypothetical protein